MEGDLFTVDTDGWIAQHSGRDLTELVREIIQNALDTGAPIEVRIDTRGKKIEVIDDGPGFDSLDNAWKIFGGDKAEDPTKRGRFGRGLKELAADTEKTTVETTSGTVVFDMVNRKRITDKDAQRASGTRIIAENDDWKMRDVKEVFEYVMSFWAPAGQEITVNLKGGRTATLERMDSDFIERMRLKTVALEDGEMSEKYRTTDVHITSATGTTGVLYEMGIPVDTEAPFPYHVDVQQKIPLAEQRNEPDNWWYKKRLMPKLLNVVYKDLAKSRLRDEWVVESLTRASDTVQEYFIEEVLRDKRKNDMVYSTDERSDDICENHGYQVFDATKTAQSISRVVRDTCKPSKELAEEIHERQEKQVEPSDDQAEVIEQMMEICEMAGAEDILIETWEIREGADGSMPKADYSPETHTIRLNVFIREWDSLGPSDISTLIHELGHVEHGDHSRNWADECTDLAGKVIAEMIDE